MNDDSGLYPDEISSFFESMYWDPGLANDSFEAVHRVSHVVYYSHSSIGFHQAVLPSDHIANPLFRLMFDITRRRVMHAVFVCVADRYLYNRTSDTLNTEYSRKME